MPEEKEREERVRREVIAIPIPFFDVMGIMLRYWPRGYEDSLKHLINANIEFLKAIDSAIQRRIETLQSYTEEVEKRIKYEKKEKVKVE